MHLRGLDLNLLVALDVLLDECNVSRAADRLRLSQSGTSTALGRLRSFFDDELLVPTGRKMLLTPLGQSLIGPVREIVLQAQALIDSSPGFDPVNAERTFTIMASDYISTVFLPTVVQRLSREAPGIIIESIPYGAVPHEPLERGDVDFLIMPEQYLSPKHPSTRLFSDHYVCISWVGNTHFKSDPDIDQYLGLGHVILRLWPTRGMAFDEWFLERFDHPRRVEATVMNFANMPHFVIGTQRIATVHNRFAQIYAKYLPVRIHPLPFEMPGITEGLQWSRFSDRHPANVWLRGILTECAETLS